MKAKLGIYKLKPTELAELAESVHTGLSANAATFSNPNPSLPELADLTTTLRDKTARKETAKAELRLAVEEERAAVTGVRGGLIRSQAYVDSIAAGQAHIILLANMGVRSRTGPTKAMPQVQNLRTQPSDFEGAVEARWALVRGAKVYLIQFCTGDPMIEANWRHADIVTKASQTVRNLPSGKVWLRVCAKGTDAKPGPWSEPVEEMVR